MSGGGFDRRAIEPNMTSMTTLDFSCLSQEERINLIGELCDSLDRDDLPVTAAQKAELEHRLKSLDEDIAQGREAAEVLADLRRRHG